MTELYNLEKKIKIKFKNKNLLKEALTHRSYLNENPDWSLPHNERMEFLGDAVLELAVTELLYNRYPDYDEGKLTSIRAALVNFQMLAQVGQSIDLADFLLLSKGEAKDGTSRAREVILANAMEALIGAIYLDTDFKKTKKFIEDFIVCNLDEILKSESYKDSKSLLQEIIQEKKKITPSYKVLEEAGPDHKKIFKVGVFFNKELAGKGEGCSKQEAELEAAKDALNKL